MRYGPPFKYAFRPDGRRIAYQVAGDGDLDLVFLFGWPTHLGLMWENPSFAGFLHKLSSFSRLILFDRSGGGLSDRGIGGFVFEDEMDDVRAVMAAVGSEQAALFGCHTGGRLALLMAATYPDQVPGVVTFGSHPATLRDKDYPWGTTAEEHEGLLAMMKAGGAFDDGAQFLEMVAPREAADASVAHWVRMFLVSAASFAEQYEGIRSLGPVDIRGLLGSVQTPVLVLHRTGDRAADVGASRYMAERIPGARFVELPGDAHFPFFGDQDTVVELAQEFLTGARPAVDRDRVLATVLFTDIVDSTSRAAGLGDRRWHHLLVEHQEVVRRQLARYRGREVKTTGDGFLATFDGPARAIRAADAIRAGVRELGLEVRVGLHTGECELLGDDIGGIAVHIAARVLAQAGAGEICCSRTVKDLVAEEREVGVARQLHEPGAGDALGHVAAGPDVGRPVAGPAGGVAGGGQRHHQVAVAVHHRHRRWPQRDPVQQRRAGRGVQGGQARAEQPPRGAEVSDHDRDGQAAELGRLAQVAGQGHRPQGVGQQHHPQHPDRRRRPPDQPDQAVPGRPDAGVDQQQGHHPLGAVGGQLGHQPAPQRVAGQDSPLHPELVQDPAEEAPVLVEAPAVVGDPAAGDVDGHHPEAGRGQPAEGLHVQPVGQQQPAGQHQGEALPADGHADPAPVHGEAVLGKPRIGGRPVGSDHLAPRLPGPRQHPVSRRLPQVCKL